MVQCDHLRAQIFLSSPGHFDLFASHTDIQEMLYLRTSWRI